MAQRTADTIAMSHTPVSRRSSCLSLDSSQPRCRLCWGEDDGEGNGKLISPCSCKGSMQYIHFGCLQHWLEVTRQQGRPRRSIRCEVCKSKYNTDPHSFIAGQDQQLMPGIWQDPFTVASFIHGAYRAYVAISGLWRAYAIYRSIQQGSCLPGATPAIFPASSATAPAAPAAPVPYYSTGRASSRAASRATLSWHQQQHQQQRQQRQDQQPLRHHLSVSLPLGGGRVHPTADKDMLAAIRDRFDSATMVQVYWYTALMALTPQPPNADAFAGMALGATIGGMMAQLVFLPMLGSGKLAALSHCCRLLTRCLIRLIAAEACQARGYRLLSAAVRAVMQGRIQWGWVLRLRRRQQQQQQQAALLAQLEQLPVRDGQQVGDQN